MGLVTFASTLQMPIDKHHRDIKHFQVLQVQFRMIVITFEFSELHHDDSVSHI